MSDSSVQEEALIYLLSQLTKRKVLIEKEAMMIISILKTDEAKDRWIDMVTSHKIEPTSGELMLKAAIIMNQTSAEGLPGQDK